MRTLLFVAAAFAFFGAAMLYFVEGHWYGALGWFLTGGYQIAKAIEMTPNV